MFNLPGNATSVRTDVLAGITTWLTMAYIIAVNPSILAAAGIDHDAAFVATCVAAAHDMGLVTGNPETLVTMGHLRSAPPLLPCIGFLIIAGLAARRVTGRS